VNFFKHASILKLQIYFALFILLCAGLSPIAKADYKEVIKSKFWGDLYKNGGKTYFCNESFTKKTPLLSVSHIYTGIWVRDHIQCGTNRQCLRSSEQYQEIMSDLHNIVPADAYFEFKRKNSAFGALDETVAANECGIRKRQHVIEPPDRIKGDIARVIFYMHERYKLPLQSSLSLLTLWHKNDPVSEAEIERNKNIDKIQRNENPFISNPSLVHNIEP
jgi:deoxyribonuclease-1